jgi:sulfur-oxidizing protein SoxZ
MADGSARLRVPATARMGEVVEIKTLLSHPMESGQRKDKAGALIPRRIVNRFVASFNGRPVFEAELHPAIAANPYLTFQLKVEASGTLDFAWTDDDGTVYTASATITVV